jgi:hypothetical protein
VSVAEVFAGTRRWHVEAAPVTCWSSWARWRTTVLTCCSPARPIFEARTYGIGAGRKLDDWVAWMTEVVVLASQKVRGLVAVNCEGQTRNYRYLPAPFLLAADLHRAGLNLRKPVVFHRVGIPGSGGPDWLRNDWEPIVCVSRPGRLPWSDPTALGHPPKWAPGGDMSHRLTAGQRVNQWGMRVRKNGRLTTTEPLADRDVERTMKPSHRVLTVAKSRREARPGVEPKVAAADLADLPPGAKLHTKDNGNGEMRTQLYIPPVKANPGNVIKCVVGGNQMGGGSASHENEAPFPLKLAEFFVLSFCPPGGIVCDPFSGSGTTCHAAVMHGRRFVGCDVRPSQVALCGRRMAGITPSLLSGIATVEEDASIPPGNSLDTSNGVGHDVTT